MEAQVFTPDSRRFGAATRLHPLDLSRTPDRIWLLSDNGARLSFGGTIVSGHEIPETLWTELAAAACRLPETDVVLADSCE